ncbi:hypothetical protein FIBSPDRAFT_926721 [Athelia psychrophila]|uniref:Uncharacterized protein n=1 Tax=Athelia psychrophila TaxID=1759441 RepID=A0A166SUI4_9AGAM|nr:hypothetical protein FIBSPDRAFT_926721 [Fibularhizoctonia sp. CBS 109695]
MLSFLFWFPFCFGSQLPLISTEDSSSFIFNSLFGLLKQWPNTLHPNGHAIVPVTISPYTLLYHARTDTQNPPPSPEWVGFVPELGYGLAQMAPSGQPTYIHTYRSTRPLRTLVFDGLSAFPTEIDVGWMDSVATFIHGAGQRGTGKNRPAHGGLAEEYERAIKLCEWGNTRNIEGFIRMNSGFELLWCDFTSSAIELVRHVNVTPPHDPHKESRYTALPNSVAGAGAPDAPPVLAFPFFSLSSFHEWARMYTLYNMVSLPFLTLHPAGMVTYYHPRLASLAGARAGQRMAHHRIWPFITNEDAISVRSEVEGVVSRDFTAGSGADWSSIVQTMVDNWTHRIGHVRLVLSNVTSSPPNSVNLTSAVQEVQLLTYSPLMPYMDTSSATNASGYDLFFSRRLSHPHESGLDRCTTQYTGWMHRSEAMTSQEDLLKTSVEIVQKRICLEFGTIFAESFDRSPLHPDPTATSKQMKRWLSQIENLSRYLDWPSEARCEQVCARDSVCAMPLWPFEPLWPELGLELIPTCQKIDVFGGPETWRKQWANESMS